MILFYYADNTLYFIKKIGTVTFPGYESLQDGE